MCRIQELTPDARVQLGPSDEFLVAAFTGIRIRSKRDARKLIMISRQVGKYLGANIFMWGFFLSKWRTSQSGAQTGLMGYPTVWQAACKDFKSLAALRILGGAAEACADPAFMLITSMWCKLHTAAHPGVMLISRQIPDDSSQFGLACGTLRTVLGLLAVACWGMQLGISKGGLPRGNTSF